MNYSAPEMEMFAVAAERGYEGSSMLPGFGGESDELATY